MKGFNTRLGEFRQLNAEILGVSTDSVYCHRAWIRTPEQDGGLGPIGYPLASDLTREVARSYDVLIEDMGISQRGLFIIDPEGILRYMVVSNIDVARSVEETLRVLQALQTKGLCPIDWKPGEKTL